MILICVSNRLLKNAFNELVAFQRALKDLVVSIDATYAKQFDEFHVGFEGSFGNKHVSPRTLSARFLGNLVCVEGIVTKCKKIFVHFIFPCVLFSTGYVNIETFKNLSGLTGLLQVHWSGQRSCAVFITVLSRRKPWKGNILI